MKRLRRSYRVRINEVGEHAAEGDRLNALCRAGD
jgi:hypothetical protein